MQHPPHRLALGAMRLVDARELGAADAAAALALQQRIDLAKDPHIPPTTEAELRALMTGDATNYARHERIVAFDGDEAAAIGHIELTNDPNNPELAEIESSPTAPTAPTAPPSPPCWPPSWSGPGPTGAHRSSSGTTTPLSATGSGPAWVQSCATPSRSPTST